MQQLTFFAIIASAAAAPFKLPLHRRRAAPARQRPDTATTSSSRRAATARPRPRVGRTRKGGGGPKTRAEDAGDARRLDVGGRATIDTCADTVFYTDASPGGVGRPRSFGRAQKEASRDIISSTKDDAILSKNNRNRTADGLK